MNITGAYTLGDMLVQYVTDAQGRTGLRLLPADRAAEVLEKEGTAEPLAQLHARGDHLANGYGNGHTLAMTSASDRMRLIRQEKQGDTIVTTLADGEGRELEHRLSWRPGLFALRVVTVLINRTGRPLTLDCLTSATLGFLTPFTPGDASGALRLHRIRSAWSAEGRLQSDSLESLNLERSWTGHALRLEKFGQIGSMPVRGWFPFMAVEDTRAGVTWAMQLACPSSWQAEVRRKGDDLAVSMGLADEDFGHWHKTLQPDERFETPECFLTVGNGGVDAVSQRLLSAQRENWLRAKAELPVLFNEYCTTWGEPSHENMRKITGCLRGHDIDFVVMDAGWYATEGGWSDCGGDWIPNETRLFPQGLKAAADLIHEAGFRAGLWFEPETCGRASEIFRREEMLLTRDGQVIDTDNRRFLDMRKEETHAYLRERVTGLLRTCGFDYIKVDYNDCIGVGCDDPDGLGEGLRRNMQGTLRFFREMRAELPDLYIENCASGGHRLEPSLMGVSDMASFSDAHECPEIPIIAAALHRVILPGQSQIWAVLRREDSLRRLNYSLINTFLGVMCLSGDITELTPPQWQKVDEGIAFFRAVRHIIRDGVSAFHGEVSESWRHPEGWQCVVREADGETLAVLHTFGGRLPDQVTVPVRAGRILRTMCSENNQITLRNGQLNVEIRAPFEAVAVHLAEH